MFANSRHYITCGDVAEYFQLCTNRDGLCICNHLLMHDAPFVEVRTH